MSCIDRKTQLKKIQTQTESECQLQSQNDQNFFNQKLVCDCQIQKHCSIIMKTKPKFTYKQFIEKISNVQLAGKDKVQKKSPRALKSHNKNIPLANDNRLQKTNLNKTPKNTVNVINRKNSNRDNFQRISPRRESKKQNISEKGLSLIQDKKSLNLIPDKQSLNLKNTTNKKLKLKPFINFQEEQKQLDSKHNASLKEQLKGNFYHNQSNYLEQKHNQSCSFFYKNQNQRDEYNNSSFGLGLIPVSLNSNLKADKKSSNGIDSKIKIVNLKSQTQKNFQRVNTQYQQCNQPYDDSDSRYKRITTQYDRQSPSFHKKSNAQFNFLDFQDNKTHQQLFGEVNTSRSKKSLNSAFSQQKKVKINEKSYQHAYNNFITKISDILFSITRIQDQNQLLEHKIKYIEFLESLKQLRMIRNDYEPYSQQGQGTDLIRQLWEQLVMGHNINHFIIIIAIILNITPLQQIKEGNSHELKNYIYLQKKYQQFRFTRLQLNKAKVYSEKQSMEYYNYPFKPTISKKSQDIMSKSKSQKKYKMNCSISHNQSLSMLNQRQNVSINTEFQQPNSHIQSITSNSMRSTSPLGNKRSEILYKQAKKKSLQKKQNKSTIDYQYQRNAEELTFKPKIIIKKKQISLESDQKKYISPRFTLDQEKSINRMIRGRVQKQIKQITVQKGLPYNQKTIQKLRKQKIQEIFKQQQQTRLKKSKIKIVGKKIQTNQQDLFKHEKQEKCVQSILDLSFQQLADSNQYTQKQEGPKEKIQNSPLDKSSLFCENQQQFNVIDDPNQSPEDFFILDIYFQENRSQKLLIKRDSTIQQVSSQAQSFVRRHKLPLEMEFKLKQELMIAMKFHDIEKIQENDEQEECSLLM